MSTITTTLTAVTEPIKATTVDASSPTSISAYVASQEAHDADISNTFVPQLNLIIGQTNTVIGELNTLASGVSTNATLAENYAILTGSIVEAGTYSAKEFAIGDLTASGGSARAWAIDTASPDGTTSKSAKTLAAEAHADVVLTHADVVLTHADVVLTHADAATCANLAGAFVSTSTTSVLIGTGSKSFTTQTGEQYSVGAFISIAYTTTPTNFMHGQVTSYNSGTGALVVDVQSIGGSGTFALWSISLSGARGATGAAGTAVTINNTLTSTSTTEALSANMGKTLQDSKIGATLAVALNTSRATVASHATTAQIWTALGNQIDWTGTATTTIFPNAPQAGAERTLICAGACSFTAGANMLIDGVASGATVTCAAGDTVIVRAISTTQFKLTRLKADGTAQSYVSGGIKSVQVFTTSGYWNKPVGIRFIKVTITGGGGGGVGGTSGSSGGGAGGTCIKYLNVSSLIDATVVVGAGSGGNGGASTFNIDSITYTGGGGSAAPDAISDGGIGGSATNGDINIFGGGGGGSGNIASAKHWAIGGASFYGGAEEGNYNTASSGNGAFGSGGGGTYSGGYSGKSGIIIIEEYA